MNWIMIVVMFSGIEGGAAAYHVTFTSQTRCEEAAAKLTAATAQWRGPYSRNPVVVAICVHDS